ncbi:helix-turn-helix transcriptional regulator [Streptococcus anginosus]|uniref:helix-turn-helix domain-containing protein n=1 Tax=Streptococcus anginosus TaxID=1328 RepID=UPI0021F90677|nr:helix-turn-helix transcriptional regulator [Streptococcus anginosus]MCW1052125.1 helix-turn-helix transcriptional regulator [Streptococcus anginosus]
MSLSENVSKRIYELRTNKKLTQETLADKAGMDVNALGRIERGQNGNIKLETLDKIIRALEIDHRTFFSFTTDEDSISKIVAKLSLVEDENRFIEIFDRILDIELK